MDCLWCLFPWLTHGIQPSNRTRTSLQRACISLCVAAAKARVSSFGAFLSHCSICRTQLSLCDVRLYSGVTASGKTHTARLLTNQILRLSTRSKRDHKIASQLTALGTLLDAFGCAKTFASPSGSRHGRWTELQFDARGRVCGGQVLTFGLDKARLVKLRPEERTYHVFYQMLMGLAGQERERLGEFWGSRLVSEPSVDLLQALTIWTCPTSRFSRPVAATACLAVPPSVMTAPPGPKLAVPWTC